jgi:hypothetical protein
VKCNGSAVGNDRGLPPHEKSDTKIVRSRSKACGILARHLRRPRLASGKKKRKPKRPLSAYHNHSSKRTSIQCLQVDGCSSRQIVKKVSFENLCPRSSERYGACLEKEGSQRIRRAGTQDIIRYRKEMKKFDSAKQQLLTFERYGLAEPHQMKTFPF